MVKLRMMSRKCLHAEPMQRTSQDIGHDAAGDGGLAVVTDQGWEVSGQLKAPYRRPLDTKVLSNYNDFIELQALLKRCST